MQELSGKGLKINDIRLKDKEGGFTTRLIFPGALVSYRDIEFPVNLLKNNPALPYQENINNSVSALEYEFMRALRSITSRTAGKVAFIEGHGELDFFQTFDLASELSLFFQVDRGAINGNLSNLLDYQALIVAQPLRPFSERDRFALDQYLMRGGKLLFFLDPVQTNSDSLSGGISFTSFLDLNIYDLLFKYGIRIDYNLVKDIQCNYIRVQTSVGGQDPEMLVLPWWYFPLLSAPKENFLTKGLNYIKTEFASALDTTSVSIPGLRRTVLLSTSDTSALVTNPSLISMAEVTGKPDRRLFNSSRLPIAILAEGTFPSFYANYSVPPGVFPPDADIIPLSEHTQIFVAGDGDMIRNEVQLSAGDTIPLPLGYDPDTRQTFGNKEFVMNVINYMTDDELLISLRSREFKLRLLDRSKIRTNKDLLKWKLLNTAAPVVLLILFAGVFSYLRKRRYGSPIQKV
jgi:ABC-2 type transport system permease protein